jgi:hypothetical protein
MPSLGQVILAPVVVLIKCSWPSDFLLLKSIPHEPSDEYLATGTNEP